MNSRFQERPLALLHLSELSRPRVVPLVLRVIPASRTAHIPVWTLPPVETVPKSLPLSSQPPCSSWTDRPSHCHAAAYFATSGDPTSHPRAVFRIHTASLTRSVFAHNLAHADCARARCLAHADGPGLGFLAAAGSRHTARTFTL